MWMMVRNDVCGQAMVGEAADLGGDDSQNWMVESGKRQWHWKWGKVAFETSVVGYVALPQGCCLLFLLMRSLTRQCHRPDSAVLWQKTQVEQCLHACCFADCCGIYDPHSWYRNPMLWHCGCTEPRCSPALKLPTSVLRVKLMYMSSLLNKSDGFVNLN